MTTGPITIHNASRVASELVVAGPFILKQLAGNVTKALGIEWTAEQAQAFQRAPVNLRAEDVVALLKQFDARGGAPAPTLALAPAPEPEAAPARREPVAASKMNGATNGSHAAAAGDMAGLTIMTELIKEVAESQRGVATMLGEINKSLKDGQEIRRELAALSNTVGVLLKLQHLTLGTLAQIAEQSLGAPFADVLGQVASEYGTIEPAVQELIAGK